MRRLHENVTLTLLAVLLSSGLDALAAAPASRTAQPSNSPLVQAAARGDRKAVRDLLEAGADVHENEGAALAAAAEAGQLSTTEELLDAGARVRGLDTTAMTPMHRAARGGSAKVLAALIDAGAVLDAVDGQGQTALMHAVIRGNDECVRALIEAGADTTIKDKQGKSAADLARNATVTEMIRARSNATAIRVRPGDDLARIVQQARDGQVIVLLAGVHEGSISVAGKSLIIRGEDPQKTILFSKQRQAAVVSMDKARLEIESVTIRSADKSEFGMVASAGHLVARNCLIEKTSSHAALATKNGRIALIRCTIDQSSGPAIASTDGATLIVRQSRFEKCKSGILSRNAAHLGVFDSTFIQTSGAISSQGAQTVVCVLNNVTEEPFVDGGKVLQMVVEGGRRIVLADNRLINPPAGIRVAGALANPATIERNGILNASAAIEFQATYAGKRPAATFNRNLIYHPRTVGVSIRNAASVLLRDNLIHSAHYGVVLNKTSATMEYNLIHSAQGTVRLDEGAQAQGTNQRLIGPVDPNLKLDEKTRRFVLAAESEALALPLQNTGRELIAAVEKIDTEASRKLASPAFKAYSAQVRAAEKLSDELASVEMRIVDSFGTSRAVAVRIWPDIGGDPGHEELLAGDLRDGARFLSLLGEGKSAVARWLAKGLESKDLAAVLEHVNARLYEMGLYDAAVADKATLSDNTRSLGDSLKKTKIEEFHLPYVLELNRAVLEEAWPEVVRRGRQVAESTHASPSALVAPGAYWIVPLEYPELTKRVTVAAKEKAQVDQPAEEMLWVTLATFEKTRPERHMLLELRAPQQRRDALSAWRSTPWERRVAAPRIGATAQDSHRALELARRYLVQVTQPFDAARFPKEQQDRETNAHYTRVAYARRIFAVAGDRSDSRRIIEACSAPRAAQVFDWMNTAAHIEARLGILENGELLNAMSSSNEALAEAAMVVLYDHGVAAAREAALKALPNKPNLIHSLARVSGDDGAREILVAIRRAATEQSKGMLTPAVAIQLIASGNPDDLRLLSQGRITSYTLTTLLPFAQDRWPVIRTLVEYEQVSNLPSLLPQLMHEGWKSAEEVAELTVNAMFHKYWTTDQKKASIIYNTWQQDISFAWPNERIAEAAYEKWPSVSINWLDRRWDDRAAPMVEKMDRNFLDYMTPADLERRFSELNAAQAMPADLAALVLASHKISTFAFTEHVSQYGGPIERRPFIIRQDGDAGAISGVVEIRPSLDAGVLRCAVRLPRACYFQRDGALILNRGLTEYPMYQYIRDDGRELLAGLKVLRGGEITEMKHMGRDQSGWLVFEADLDRHDLSGVNVVTGLSFFGQTHQITFAMFDGELARRMRRQTTGLAKVTPTDRQGWLALARAQAKAGLLDEARASFGRAEEPGVIEEMIGMYAGARLYAKAAAVIEGAIAANPNRADLHVWLASARFGDAKYSAAADAAKRALELGADVPKLQYTIELCGYLAGATADFNQAKRLLIATPQNDLSRSLAQSVLAREKGVNDALKQSNSRSDRCLVLTCAGYAAMQANDAKSARSHFQSALWAGNSDQVEYRMAQFALSKLESNP